MTDAISIAMDLCSPFNGFDKWPKFYIGPSGEQVPLPYNVRIEAFRVWTNTIVESLTRAGEAWAWFKPKDVVPGARVRFVQRPHELIIVSVEKFKTFKKNAITGHTSSWPGRRKAKWKKGTRFDEPVECVRCTIMSHDGNVIVGSDTTGVNEFYCAEVCSVLGLLGDSFRVT